MSWRHRPIAPHRPNFHAALVATGQRLPTIGHREPTQCDLIGSNERNWLYVGIPLTGSRTVIATLGPRAHPELWRERGATNERLEVAGVDAGRFVFSIVGNPWRRVVSCFNKKILNCNTPAKIAMLSRHAGLSPSMGFDSFVRWLASESGRDAIADPHWCSQALFLRSRTGRQLVNAVGRAENLESDLASFLEECGEPPRPTATRRRSSDMPTPPLHVDYRSYYDDELADIVAHRYAIDIEAFSYRF